MRVNFIAAIAGIVILSACQMLQPVPQTPKQAVYEAKGDYIAALALANAYGALPTCPTAAPICKTKATLDLIDDTAHKASVALALAQDDVNQAVAPASLTADLQDATLVVQTLATLTSGLKTK